MNPASSLSKLNYGCFCLHFIMEIRGILIKLSRVYEHTTRSPFILPIACSSSSLNIGPGGIDKRIFHIIVPRVRE